MKSTFIAFKKSAFTLLTTLTVLFGTTAMALPVEEPNPIVGIWKTGDGNAVVRIYKNGDKFQGKNLMIQKQEKPN
jgi:uncharacterized protein (DUF2147 family)